MAGLVTYGGGDDGKYFLNPVERMLLRWCVLDSLGQNLVQDLWEPRTTPEQVGGLYARLENMTDEELVCRFNDMVEQISDGASTFMPVYDAVRLEVRGLLSRKPLEETLAGTRLSGDGLRGLDAEMVERATRCLHDNGAAFLRVGSSRYDPVEAWDAERMLAREMLLSIKDCLSAKNLD